MILIVYLFWQNDTTYFGNIVGRVANRIGGAQFGINGVFYKLTPNDGRNLLHGIHSFPSLFSFPSFSCLIMNSFLS